MRIMMLAQWYAPIIGGEERHVQSLAHALAKRGHEVSIVTLAYQDAPALEIEGTVRVHRIRAAVQRMPWLFTSARQSAPPFPDPAITWKLRSLIRDVRPEVIHAHNWLVHSYLPLHRRSSAPLVVTLHDYGLLCAKKNLMFRGGMCDGPALSKCLRCASEQYGLPKAAVTVAGVLGGLQRERRVVDRFVALCEAVAEGNRLPPSIGYDVIPNFIPDSYPPVTPDVDPLLARLPTIPYIMFAGGLAKIKGIDILLRAYERLSSPPPLVLIGYRTSETLDSLDRLPDGVTLLTDWPHVAVMEAWRRSLFGVVPSTWAEPFATVALEAMAVGRALVASRIGGLADIVQDGRTGLHVPAGDESALSSAMHRLITDQRLCEQLGEAAAAEVEKYRERAVVPQLERLYERLTIGPRSGLGQRVAI